MEWTISTTDRKWIELAELLRTEWQGAGIDRQRALALADQLMPHCPDMRHTLTHLSNRLAARAH